MMPGWRPLNNKEPTEHCTPRRAVGRAAAENHALIPNRSVPQHPHIPPGLLCPDREAEVLRELSTTLPCRLSEQVPTIPSSHASNPASQAHLSSQQPCRQNDRPSRPHSENNAQMEACNAPQVALQHTAPANTLQPLAPAALHWLWPAVMQLWTWRWGKVTAATCWAPF